jgi:exopolysaccharide biosynthesis polyprenyl glycosylphosphotransferase
VSSLSLHPGQQKPPGTDWAARLIPGSAFASPPEKKARRSASAKTFPGDTVTSSPVDGAKRWHLATSLCSEETQGPVRANWSRSVLTDFVIVILDWVLIGQICVLLRATLGLRVFSDVFFISPVSRTLIGIALLHGFLINLLDLPGIANTDLRKQTLALGKAIFLGTLVLSAALQLQGFTGLAVAAIWIAGVLHFSALSARRWAGRIGYKPGLRSARGRRNVLIVGACATRRQIADHMAKHPEMDRSVCGFLDDEKPMGNGVLGRTSDLPELARTGFVDEVILASPQNQEVTLHVLSAARQLRLDVKMAPQLFGCDPIGQLESLGNIPLISLHEEKVPVAGLLVKRALDVTGAATALIFLAPALLLISILIKTESLGPILYKGMRVGRKGRPFHCYKFRTMVRNADDLKASLRSQNQRSGPFFKISCDPRITRIGQFLRRYSLDELPQLWNVLQGEMSMVGPRPHPLDDVSEYSIQHLPRLDVVPGITGLWQVAARHDPSFQNGLNLDIEYIRRWSLKMDLSILLRTAGAVLRGSGE